MSSLRAEHASLDEFLCQVLSPQELTSVFLPSFTQWSFSLAALTEIGLALRESGSEVAFGFWAGQTPLPDVGYSCPNWVAALTASRTRDGWTKKALKKAGFPGTAFVRPPIVHWKPLGDIPSNPLNVRSKIRQLMYRGSPMGRAILQLRPDHAVPVTDEYRWPQPWLERSILSYAYVFDQSMAVINETNATSVFAYNGRFLHDSAVAAATEQRGLPVLSYDTGGLDTDFDLTIDATHDWSALQDRMKQMMANWPAEEAHSVGGSWFTDRRNHAEEANRQFTGGQMIGRGIERSPDEVVATYFSSSGDEMVEMDLDWSEYFHSQEQAVRTLAQVCAELPDTTLIVRTHPHMRLKPADDLACWVDAIDSIGGNIHIPPDSPTDSYALMRAADRVITYGSTSGIEAAYRERPVAVMGPSAYQLLDCVTPVHSADDLKRWLIDDTATNPQKSLPYGLMMQRRGFHHEWLQRQPGGQLERDGIALMDAAPRAQKVSHSLNSVTTKWLTRS